MEKMIHTSLEDWRDHKVVKECAICHEKFSHRTEEARAVVLYAHHGCLEMAPWKPPEKDKKKKKSGGMSSEERKEFNAWKKSQRMVSA